MLKSVIKYGGDNKELNTENTNLSTRTLNLLSKNNINTVDQLLDFVNSRKFFSKKIRGLGRQSNFEIIQFIREVQGITNPKHEKLESKIRELDLAEFEHSLKLNIEKYGVDMIAKICIKYTSRSTD